MSQIDFRVEPVEGAPISLKKVRETIRTGNMTVLIDNASSGFVNDDPNLVDISIQAREEQAKYFFDLKLDKMPEYLRKYLAYMYEDEDEPDLDAMFRYGGNKPEFYHIVAIIQMVSYALKKATAANKSVAMYIEEPETRMHPKRERRIMGLLHKLQEDYGPKKEGDVPQTKIL